MFKQKAKGRRQKAKGRRQKAEGKRQKAEGKRQKAKGRRQKAKGKKQKAKKGLNCSLLFVAIFLQLPVEMFSWAMRLFASWADLQQE